MLNPRLTKRGLLQPPLPFFFSGSSKTLKKVTKGIWVISFTSFAVIFMKKIGGTTLPGGRVSRQSQRGGVDATFSVLRKQKIRHFEKYLHTMMLKLTEHVEITISLLYMQKKNGEILIFRTFIVKFSIFAYFRQKSQFSSIFRSGMSLWRHNYVTPWLIVLILVRMDREGPYLSIDTKINFIGGSVWKI